MQLLLPKAIDLPATLLCGQTFLWQELPAGYLGCVENNAALLVPHENGYLLHWQGEADANYWHWYFRCDGNNQAIANLFLRDRYIQLAYANFPGLNILRQPVWETLCMFIISANNNTKRIQGIVQRLSAQFGLPHRIGSYGVYAFPTPFALVSAGEQALRDCGLGYRAPYLYQTARRVLEGYPLSCLQNIGYTQALQELMQFPGVGEKVADCILLFSCGYTNAFPVDTWIRRVLQQLYGSAGNTAAIKAHALQLFGEHAGIVQQWLFHAARTGLYPELTEKK